MEMKKLWPVYKGGSFNLWQPDTGKYFALADPERVKEHLQRKRQNQANTRSSAFYSADEAWVEDPRTLPSNFPRVAYRDVALLYGLDENDLRLIWQTFHPTTDHLSELDEVLWHHHNLQSEL